MTLGEFHITGGASQRVAGDGDEQISEPIIGLRGVFVSNIPAGFPVPVDGGIEYIPERRFITGEDGLLYEILLDDHDQESVSDTPGINLTAADAMFGDTLQWQYVPGRCVIGGKRIDLLPFWFDAKPADWTGTLDEITPVPDTDLKGIAKGAPGEPGSPGTPGANGRSITDFRATGDGSYGQAYGLNEDGDEVPIGDPVPLTVAWTTVTNWDDPDTPRPGVSGSVIWIGLEEPSQAIFRDVRINCSGQAPSITTTILNGMNIGAVFSQMLQADGTTPLVWTKLTGTLPTGLTLSTEGNLFGTPSATGSFTFELEARNPFGASTHTYTVTVGSAIGPSITTASVTGFQVGVAFDQQMTASGSTPISWDKSAGAFPAGVTMDSSGHITGTPTTIGSGTVTIRATNTVNAVTHTYSWSVSGTAPTITDTSLGALWRGFAISKSLAASGSTPITYAKISGSYPSGVSMNSSGVFSGTPDTVQSYSFSVQASNAYGDSAIVTFSGNVQESTPVIVENSLDIVLAAAFSKQLTLTSGGPTITWSVISGAFPTGISMNSSGLITGTTSATGAYSVTVRADNGTEHDDQVFSGNLATVTNGAAWSVLQSGVLATSFTGSYTAGAGEDVWFTIDTASGGSTFLVNTFTYGGVALTKVAEIKHANSSFGYTHVYRGAGLGNGSARAISLSFFGGQWFSLAAGAYKGVGTVGTPVTSYGNSTTPSCGPVTCPSGGMILCVIGGGSSVQTTITSSSGGTLRVSQVSGPSSFLQHIVRDANADTTFGAVFGAAQQWSCIAIPLSA